MSVRLAFNCFSGYLHVSDAIHFVRLEYLVAAASSLAAWAWIAARRSNRTPILSHAPRRDVPWGSVGLIIAVLMLALKIIPLVITPLFGDSDPRAVIDDPAPATFIWQAVLMGVAMLWVTGGIAAVLVLTRGANWRDLGLPSTWTELLDDIRVGVVTFAATIIPVYGIKIALVKLTDEKVAHPLLEKLIENPSGPLFLVIVFSAVIVAPIFEEFVYRLLLQGWLEKIERPNFTDRADPSPLPDGVVAEQILPKPPRETNVPSNPGLLEETEPAASSRDSEPFGSHRSWMALPFGVGPILISALLFSLAHLGHGFDPIPLFILGAIYGYIYYRTHRLLPCILAHMFLNGFSLTLFWIELVWHS